MTRIMAAARYGRVQVVGRVTAFESGTEMGSTREPLPVEMYWMPEPEKPCTCEDCDEYLWFRADAPRM